MDISHAVEQKLRILGVMLGW